MVNKDEYISKKVSKCIYKAR